MTLLSCLIFFFYYLFIYLLSKVFVMMFMVWYFQFGTLAVVFLSNSMIYPEHSCVPSAFNLPPTEIGNTFSVDWRKIKTEIILILAENCLRQMMEKEVYRKQEHFSVPFPQKMCNTNVLPVWFLSSFWFGWKKLLGYAVIQQILCISSVTLEIS